MPRTPRPHAPQFELCTRSVSTPVEHLFHVGFQHVCDIFLHVCVCVCVCAAGEDAADDSMPGADMLPPAVLRRHAVHPDEREEAHLGVSCVRQEGPL